MDLPYFRAYDLPGTSGRDQEKRFQRLLGIVLLICIALSIVWPFIPVPEPDPFDVEEIPPRLAQLMLEEEPLPPPPPPELASDCSRALMCSGPVPVASIVTRLSVGASSV